MESYTFKNCKLCNSHQYKVLVNKKACAITSDFRKTNRDWIKVECEECGLVREGSDFDFSELANHYTEHYAVNASESSEEHMFFKNGEPIPRNKAVAEMVAAIISKEDRENIKTICEIGAGQGNLIQHLCDIWPNSKIKGVELNQTATDIARKKGIDVDQGDESAVPHGQDLIIAITVFEHVPNPQQFLNNIYNKLNTGGLLYLFQPLQNDITYDIFYTDHLHHFGLKHVEWFGNKAGFIQEKCIEDTWFSKCCSQHLFRKVEQDTIPSMHKSSLPKVAESIAFWGDTVQHFDDELKQLEGAKLAIYGLSEVYKLMLSTTRLSQDMIYLGIDDYKGRAEQWADKLTIKSLNELSQEDLSQIDVCILAMSPIYYEQVEQKCANIGLKTLRFWK